MLPQPPSQVRMGDGRYVPMQADFGQGPQQPQKFLIVIQFYDGDVAEAEDLANIIADLERVKNRDADIMLFNRHDARPFPTHTKAKLESKFDKVHEVRCRSRDGTTYPFGSNCMFYDLVALLGQYPQWNQPYFAFINLETDCVPVHPGWIRELIMEFKIAQVHGKTCIGHINASHATPHMNGVGVYPIDMYFKVPGGRLGGGDLAIAYDLFHAKAILPLAYDTPLIMMEYRQPTITAAELFKAHKSGIEPALYHGVKDASAREAVRARYITFSEKKDLSRATVFTHFDSTGDINVSESQQVLDLWKDGWKSRGWNPVVLGLRDAAKNPQYAAVAAAVAKFPYAGPKQEQKNLFMRWLALESAGGGLLVGTDQLPNAYTPEKAKLPYWNKERLAKFIQAVIDFTVQSDDSINDIGIMAEHGFAIGFKASDFETVGWREADIVSFTATALAASTARGKRKSDVMRDYLGGA